MRQGMQFYIQLEYHTMIEGFASKSDPVETDHFHKSIKTKLKGYKQHTLNIT